MPMKKIVLFICFALIMLNYHFYLSSQSLLVRDDMHKVTVVPAGSHLELSGGCEYLSLMNLLFNFLLRLGFSSLDSLSVTIYLVYLFMLVVFIKVVSLRACFTASVVATIVIALNPLSLYLAKNLIYFTDQVILIMLLLFWVYKKNQKVGTGFFDVGYWGLYFYCLTLYSNFIIYAFIFSAADGYIFMERKNKKYLIGGLLLISFFIINAEAIFTYILIKADYLLEGDKVSFLSFIAKSWTLFEERLIFNVTVSWSVFYLTVFAVYLFYSFTRKQKVSRSWHLLIIALAVLPMLAVLLTIYLPSNRGIQSESSMVMDMFLSFVLVALMLGDILSAILLRLKNRYLAAGFGLLCVFCVTTLCLSLKQEMPYVRLVSKYKSHLGISEQLAIKLSSLKKDFPAIEVLVVSYGEDFHEALVFMFQYLGIKFKILRIIDFSEEKQRQMQQKKHIMQKCFNEESRKIFDLYMFLTPDKALEIRE